MSNQTPRERAHKNRVIEWAKALTQGLFGSPPRTLDESIAAVILSIEAELAAKSAQLTALSDTIGRLDKALLERNAQIADLQKELEEQCRINGMGAQRELKLMTQLAEARKVIERVNRAINSPKCECCDEGLEASPCTCWDYLDAMDALKKELPVYLAAHPKEGGK